MPKYYQEKGIDRKSFENELNNLEKFIVSSKGKFFVKL
jgi:hypothetical protein